MPIVTILCVGLVAGFHAALYGACRDAPHESFLPRRFIRELAIAAGVSAVLGFTHVADHQSLFIVYVSIFALSRIVAEFWKLFLRVAESRPGHAVRTSRRLS
jgi:hypothetical protein